MTECLANFSLAKVIDRGGPKGVAICRWRHLFIWSDIDRWSIYFISFEYIIIKICSIYYILLYLQVKQTNKNLILLFFKDKVRSDKKLMQENREPKSNTFTGHLAGGVIGNNSRIKEMVLIILFLIKKLNSYIINILY